ncbi:UNVERIFIED_ORG: hypothetical protein LHJ69_04470 [Shinella sp. XGS7]|jgi:hypothetical protein|nr:hypothetical protein [Shinella sp. XGS7]
MSTANDLQSAILQAIQQAALPTATALNMPNMLVLDEGGLGDFPWFWQNGTNFNAKTYAWLNNVFGYDATNKYLSSNLANYMTSYYDVLMDTSYVLSAADESALNSANMANATIVNSIISDWTTTQGAFPAGTNTQNAQLSYVTSQVLTWGAAGLTLGTLRASTNPMSLLPNRPLGSEGLVSDLMTYLGDTSSVANIQAAVVSFNNQLAQTRANVQPAPTTVSPGWMQIIDNSGQMQIVPQFNIAESTAVIQNNLLPQTGQGKNIVTTISASKASSNTVNISASGGIKGFGSVLDLFGIFGQASASYNLWSFDESTTAVDIEIAFNGVTTVTPAPVSYNISTGKGWWNPAPLASAASYNPSQSGYRFMPDPGINFAPMGNFGQIARLLISQQPVFTLTFHTSNYQAFTQKISESSSWGVSFLGIPLAGGSQSYFQANTRQDASGGTVTITMTPVGNKTPVSPADQLAYVIGAEVLWVKAG